MIRREPTLIALNDNDVQDVRDLLARRPFVKQDQIGDAQATDRVTSLDPAMEEYRKMEEERRLRNAASASERLGLR